jgi:glycosyltransferase involved in cell wall biosynthesis
LLYVSHLSPYKHQDLVVEAVRRVRAAGVPVVLDLVGPVGFRPTHARLERVLAASDPRHEFVRWRGEIPYPEMQRTYAACDLFVFASTCESFGLIVLEAMASGLPIACADCSAPPEVLGPAGAYFKPLDAASLAAVLERLLRDPDERERLARAALARAKTFDWQRCARDTFGFVCAAGER